MTPNQGREPKIGEVVLVLGQGTARYKVDVINQDIGTADLKLIGADHYLRDVPWTALMISPIEPVTVQYFTKWSGHSEPVQFPTLEAAKNAEFPIARSRESFTIGMIFVDDVLHVRQLPFKEWQEFQFSPHS